MKHYACMVDVMARAGNLEEALEFIQNMPIKAGISVWGSFLHGCKLHSRLEFGEEAIKKMAALHPETPDFYVLMSNLYTSYGRWDKSQTIRRWMQEQGLVKLPGCSSVGHENGWWRHRGACKIEKTMELYHLVFGNIYMHCWGHMAVVTWKQEVFRCAKILYWWRITKEAERE